MNLSTSFAIAAVSGVLSTAPLSAAILYQWDFADTTTFPLSETIIGKENWVASSIDSGAETDAAIVSSSEGNAVRIYSTNPGADTGKKRTTVRNSFTRTSAADLHIQIKMGWEWSGLTTSQTAGISLGTQDWSVPLIIDFSSTHGIRAVGGATTTLLSAANVKQGYIYQFDAALDYETKTFSITIAGIDSNDNPIHHVFSDLAFGAGANGTGINGLFAFNYRGDLQDVMIQNVTIASAPIPEAGTVSLLAVGALLFGGVTILRKRNGEN